MSLKREWKLSSVSRNSFNLFIQRGAPGSVFGWIVFPSQREASPFFVWRLHVFLCVHTDFLGLPMCWFPSIVWRLKNRLEVCSRACSSAYVLSPDERSSRRFHQPQHGSTTWMKGTTLWAIRLTPTGVFRCSPPFSLMEQKTRGDCIIHFTPSRVLRFLPSAPSENMRCSAIYHHRLSFSRMLLLKLCDSVPGKKKKKRRPR